MPQPIEPSLLMKLAYAWVLLAACVDMHSAGLIVLAGLPARRVNSDRGSSLGVRGNDLGGARWPRRLRALILLHARSATLLSRRLHVRDRSPSNLRAVALILCVVAACRATASNDGDALHAEVEALVAEGRVVEALARADRAIALDADLAGAWRERTRCLVLQSDFDGALLAVERAIELEPSDAWSHYERGYLLRQMGRDDEAITAFTRAIEIDPRHFKAYEHRAGTHLDWGRDEQALADFTRAIECWDPQDRGVWEAYSLRARALMNLGRSSEALVDLDRAEAVRNGDR